MFNTACKAFRDLDIRIHEPSGLPNCWLFHEQRAFVLDPNRNRIELRDSSWKGRDADADLRRNLQVVDENVERELLGQFPGANQRALQDSMQRNRNRRWNDKCLRESNAISNRSKSTAENIPAKRIA